MLIIFHTPVQQGAALKNWLQTEHRKPQDEEAAYISQNATQPTQTHLRKILCCAMLVAANIATSLQQEKSGLKRFNELIYFHTIRFGPMSLIFM